MDGVLTVVDVVTILSLEFVCSLADDLGDFVRAFLGWIEFAGSQVFGVLVESTQHPVSKLEGPCSDVLVVVMCHPLMVSCSWATSYAPQLMNGVEAVIELLPVSVFIEPLEPQG